MNIHIDTLNQSLNLFYRLYHFSLSLRLERVTVLLLEQMA